MERQQLTYFIPGEKVDIRYFDNYTVEDQLNHLIRGLGHALARGREPNIPYSSRKVRDGFVLRSRSI